MSTDDVLRRVPSFSLFRRSSSVAAHPTAQGVSLRGVGPSGVSRTLVLLDGVSMNDPFGGWISWSRVPPGSVDKAEIIEGSSANLFGSSALGGAINLITPRPRTTSLALDVRRTRGCGRTSALGRSRITCAAPAAAAANSARSRRGL